MSHTGLTILVKCLRHKIRRWKPPASDFEIRTFTLSMYVAITRALVCVYSHVCVHYCRILCVYTVCVNVLCMVEVKISHLHLHNKLSLACVIFVHSVNHQSLPITLPHTPVVSQTTQLDEKPLAVTQYHFTFLPATECPSLPPPSPASSGECRGPTTKTMVSLCCSTAVQEWVILVLSSSWTPCWRGSRPRRLSTCMSS